MRERTRPLVVLASIAVAAVVVGGQVVAPPPWAYGFTTAGSEPVAPPCASTAKPLDCARVQAPRPKDVLHTLAGSARTFTEYQIHYDYGPADWFPDDHPAMPDIVARGRQSDTLRACSLCHYPNGHGRPENASPAGLPATYILQQLEAFRNGTRKSADPRKANANEMIQIARHLTAAEMTTVADYFSSIKRRPWITVVETDTAPRTRAGVNGLFLPLPGGERNRSVGASSKSRRMRNSPSVCARRIRATWRMCRPAASHGVKRSSPKGAAQTVQCTLCHGLDLQGAANVPGIADRPASYIVRQLHDIQAGTRQSPMMKPVVAKLNDDDMVAIAAYLGSK